MNTLWRTMREVWQRRLVSEDPLSPYERRNQQMYWTRGEGMPIPLYPKGIFWSRGWRGCPQCHGNVTTHQPTQFYRVVHAGTITEGWSCTGQPGTWAP